jgi:2-amino-4-hydroxy-6-hydroxymethyldihydropteridine diphosphokinase
MTRAFLGLGTNLGDRQGELRSAIERLEVHGDVVAVSGLYETEPVGGPEQGKFLNLVVELETEDTPEMLLLRCQDLEVAAQRVRTVRNGPRTLDADVLWVDGQISATEELTVPHPRMFERRFVIAPLQELAPDLVSDAMIAAATGEVDRIGVLDLTDSSRDH